MSLFTKCSWSIFFIIFFILLIMIFNILTLVFIPGTSENNKNKCATLQDVSVSVGCSTGSLCSAIIVLMIGIYLHNNTECLKTS